MKAFLKILLVIIAAAIAGQILLAAAPGTGKIMGHICDNEGLPVPGATVVIEGTSIGASSNFDGSYVILNVPQGVHTVISYCICYGKETARDLFVKADSSISIDFILTPIIIREDSAIVIECVKP